MHELFKFVNRRQYFWMMLALFVGLPIGGAVLFAIFPSLESLSNPINTAVLLLMAMLTGGRLADAGYRRWIGYMGVFVLGLVGPIVMILVVIFGFGVQVFELLLWPLIIACVLALLAFVVWAGTRPTIPPAELLATVFDDDGDDRIRHRAEPRF
jgi:hypothetical protein